LSILVVRQDQIFDYLSAGSNSQQDFRLV